MNHRALFPALPAVFLGCAASTPPAEQPQPAPTGEVAVIDLNATQPPPPAAAKADARKEAQQAGILGVLKSSEDKDGSISSVFGSSGLEGKDSEAKGNMWGDQIGDSFGAGGLGVGGLGLAGAGRGGGGTGEGIGLGNIGTIGHSGGAGTGQGFGSGSGHLGGSSSKPPQVRMGATNVSGRLPPEVIQRIVRQSFGRFRLCYENGLRNSPNLQGKISVKFVIGKDGAVTSTTNGGSDLPDSGVVNCVVRAFQGLTFPQPEGGVVVVVYPIFFSPGDDSAAKKPAPAPAPASTSKPASPPPAPAKQP